MELFVNIYHYEFIVCLLCVCIHCFLVLYLVVYLISAVLRDSLLILCGLY